eukprot:XP_016660255.1 PREDICTED: piwi-like protein 1 isoform X1 [Acyrthosiphon pisum]
MYSFLLQISTRNYEDTWSSRIWKRLEVWPGFITTIDEFENGLYIMCAEVSLKVLRVQTALQIMTNIMMNAKTNKRDSKQAIKTALCGSTVITRYSFKTYKVYDVDFEMNPLSTFEQNGVEETYKDYFKKKFYVEIQNLEQPMVITTYKKMQMIQKFVV